MEVLVREQTQPQAGRPRVGCGVEASTHLPLNRTAAGLVTCPNQYWLGDSATVVANAAQQKIGMIAGQAGRRGEDAEHVFALFEMERKGK